MTHSWKTYAIASMLAITTVGVFVWRRKKRTYIKVGKISKLFFYPVKSLKGVEVTKGICTKEGFEVNGILDRQFMLMSKDNVLLSQRDAPTLQLLTPYINENYLLISGPEVETLKVLIRKSLLPNDKVVECRVHTDMVQAVDVGDEAAFWFQSYLKISGVRLVQYLPNLPNRKYIRNDPFYAKMRKNHSIGFQDLAALHIVSTSSLEDLNTKIEGKKVSLYNFRPIVLVEESKPYEEDAWEYIKFEGGVEAELLLPTTRCLLTTNDPETAVLSQKEPLITLRKYRIPKDPEMVKKTGSVPCFGTHCAVTKPGEIKVGSEIYAVVGKQPAMIQKM